MTTQEDFNEELADAVMTWIESWSVENDRSARSDWIIYALMELAGSILAHAPDDLRGHVLMQAVEFFANASGARVDHLDVSRVPQTVN